MFGEFDDEGRAVVANQTDRLNQICDEVLHHPFPHSSQVDVELRELRCYSGGSSTRVQRFEDAEAVRG